MTDLILPRRKFLAGLGAMFAAPAIVRAASLMPVKVIRPEPYRYVVRTSLPTGSWRMYNSGVPISDTARLAADMLSQANEFYDRIPFVRVS